MESCSFVGSCFVENAVVLLRRLVERNGVNTSVKKRLLLDDEISTYKATTLHLCPNGY
jgi:hypothetical protein